jgi:hypothetical protein
MLYKTHGNLTSLNEGFVGTTLLSCSPYFVEPEVGNLGFHGSEMKRQRIKKLALSCIKIESYFQERNGHLPGAAPRTASTPPTPQFKKISVGDP